MNHLNPAAFVNPALTSLQGVRPQCILRPNAMGLMHAQGHQMIRPMGIPNTLGQMPSHFNPAMGGMGHHPLLVLDQQTLLQHQHLLQQQQQQQLLAMQQSSLHQSVLGNQVMVSLFAFGFRDYKYPVGPSTITKKELDGPIIE